MTAAANVSCWWWRDKSKQLDHQWNIQRFDSCLLSHNPYSYTVSCPVKINSKNKKKPQNKQDKKINSKRCKTNTLTQKE